jgi:hypothetical protein
MEEMMNLRTEKTEENSGCYITYDIKRFIGYYWIIGLC